MYSLTGKGLDALRDYARTPVTFPPLKSEPLLRLLIADLVGEEVTRESMATLRDDIADLEARLDESARAADELPAPARVPAAGQRLPARGYVDLHRELVDRVERELD